MLMITTATAQTTLTVVPRSITSDPSLALFLSFGQSENTVLHFTDRVKREIRHGYC